MSGIPDSLDGHILHLCEQMSEASMTALVLPIQDLSQSAAPAVYNMLATHLAYLVQSMALKGVCVNLDLIRDESGIK